MIDRLISYGDIVNYNTISDASFFYFPCSPFPPSSAKDKGLTSPVGDSIIWEMPAC